MAPSAMASGTGAPEVHLERAALPSKPEPPPSLNRHQRRAQQAMERQHGRLTA